VNLSSVLLYSLLYSSKCHEWSAAPISTCLRRGPRGCFRSDCWACGESMSAPRVNRFLYTHPPTQNTRLDRPQVPTGNRTMSPSFGDLSLTNCNIQTVEPAIFLFCFFLLLFRQATILNPWNYIRAEQRSVANAWNYVPVRNKVQKNYFLKIPYQCTPHIHVARDRSGQGRIQGGTIRAIAPPKPTKVTLFTLIFYNSENSIRDVRPFCRRFLWQQCCHVYFIPVTIAKPLWDLTTKYYWNRPPNVIGWIRP